MVNKINVKTIISFIILLNVALLIGCNNNESSNGKQPETNNSKVEIVNNIEDVDNSEIQISEDVDNSEIQVREDVGINVESIYDQIFDSNGFKSVYNNHNTMNDALEIYQLDTFVEKKYNIVIDVVTGYEQTEGLLYYNFHANDKSYLLNPISKQLFEKIDDSSRIIVPILIDDTIEVMGYFEFVSSVQPNVKIILWEGNYDSTTYIDEKSINDYVLLEDFSTTICNVENLSIIGHPQYGRRVDFITDDPDATVLNFKNCNDVLLKRLKLSHSEFNDACWGVTGWIKDSTNIVIDECDLYGCGRVGISINNSMGVIIRNSYIYDCSEYEIFILSSKDILFENCIIEDINELDIEIINTFNVTFLDSIIIEHDDTPQFNSHVYMLFSDVDLLLGRGESDLLYLNADSFRPFSDKSIEDIGRKEHPKMINTWIGNKASYETYLRIKNNIETENTKVTILDLNKDSDNTDANKLQVTLSTTEEINIDYLEKYITYFYDTFSNEESVMIFPLELTFNAQVKIEIKGKDDLIKWEQSGDLLNGNIEVSIIDFDYDVSKILGSEITVVTTEEIQNTINEFLLADGRFDTSNYDDGRRIEWQFEDIYVDQNMLKYRYSFLFGTPFIGDLFHRDTFGTIEIDGVTGEVHMIDNNDYDESLSVLSDEYFSFFESEKYSTNDLKYYPENSISFVIYEDDESIIIIQILFIEVYEGIYASPVRVHISKDNLGEVDFNTYYIDYDYEMLIRPYD